jgi:V8-like Glu-specific endopeptidase
VPRPDYTPTASTPSAGGRTYPTVGAIFPQGTSGPHTCTASVVASSTNDTIITAAHCVVGTAAGMAFVPGYDAGRAPYGTWQVTGAYVSDAWQRQRSPAADYAVLTVAPRDLGSRRVQIADVTGSETLGPAPAPRTTVTVVAYNRAPAENSVVCNARVYLHDGTLSFACHGFVGGSSGAPWLTANPGSNVWTLRGVIGGLYQGGCEEYRSHSSVFTDAVEALLVRAEGREHPDSVAAGGASGC